MSDAINSLIQLEFHDESVHDLRGRQSVRTTFKLTQRSIHALSILAGQLGIRQKSLFDYLIDDIQALRLIAENVKRLEAAEQRVAKTYVISRKALENLEQISTSCNTPRDALVEFSIETDPAPDPSGKGKACPAETVSGRDRRLSAPGRGDAATGRRGPRAG